MPLEIVDEISIASGAANEDRIGVTGAVAWVIDGATDVLEAPLTPHGTDAAWFAGALDDLLRRRSALLPNDPADWPRYLAADLAQQFLSAARRPPNDRSEHPSASGIIVRWRPGFLDYVSVGDCTLITTFEGDVVRLGADLKDAGDKSIASAIAAFHASVSAPKASETFAHILPGIRARRATMNTPQGYGVLSITPTPAPFVRSGRIPAPTGTRILLASDGLMRLVDVYEGLTVQELWERVDAAGLEPLAAELRALESRDAECHRYPRAKARDDASGLVVRIVR